MTVFEYDGRLLIVDCGVLFPEDDQPGVDLILPDFDYIRDRLDDIEAVVLTHGHEDHIGAVPYLLRERAGHPAGRLAAHAGAGRGQAARAPDQAVHARGAPRASVERLGPFELRVRRGQPLDPRRAGGRDPHRRRQLVLHTGDFKMDQLPLDGRITDLRAFARLGDEGVDLFLVDSTNAEVPGFVTPERDIGPVLDAVFAAGRAPDHRRLLRLPRAPRPADPRRRGARTAARSPSSAARWCATWASPATSATCTIPAGAGRRRRRARRPARRRGRADLHRLAGRADGRAVADGQPRPPRSAIGEGDTVMLASSLIPGNENAVFRVINGLSRLGRQRRAQGQRAGARLRPRRRRRAALPATTSSGRAT